MRKHSHWNSIHVTLRGLKIGWSGFLQLMIWVSRRELKFHWWERERVRREREREVWRVSSDNAGQLGVLRNKWVPRWQIAEGRRNPSSMISENTLELFYLQLGNSDSFQSSKLLPTHRVHIKFNHRHLCSFNCTYNQGRSRVGLAQPIVLICLGKSRWLYLFPLLFFFLEKAQDYRSNWTEFCDVLDLTHTGTAYIYTLLAWPPLRTPTAVSHASALGKAASWTCQAGLPASLDPTPPVWLCNLSR
jgi:hypothetical protein